MEIIRSLRRTGIDPLLLRKRAYLFVVLLLAGAFTANTEAQTNPTFTEGGETYLGTTSSPTTIEFNNAQYLLFPFGGGPSIYYAVNTGMNTINFSDNGTEVDGVTATTGATAAVFNNVLYIAYATAGPGMRIDSTINGTAWNNVNFSISGVPGPSYSGFRPSLAAVNGLLYLSYNSSGYTYVVSSGDGVHFGNGIVVSNTETTQNSPYLVVFNNTLYDIYTIGTTGNVLVAQLVNGSYFSSVVDGAIAIGDSPTAAAYGNTLYIGGKALSSSNFVMTATTNGTTFSAPTKYGQTLSYSPSLATFGSDLYECERSNFGDNIWCYIAGL